MDASHQTEELPSEPKLSRLLDRQRIKDQSGDTAKMESSIDCARFNMVQQQIRPWDMLDDRVLGIMADIPREAFVPDAYRGLAYADIEIPLNATVCMLAPKIVGRLLQALDVRPGDRILEIGTGSGYVTACLSRLGARIISIEIDTDLADEARARLAAFKLEWIDVRDGDGLTGPVQGGPFDAILLTGSMPTDAALPMLQEQLTTGGRLVCVLGEAPAMSAIRVNRLAGDVFHREALFETCVPPLEKAQEPERFVF